MPSSGLSEDQDLASQLDSQIFLYNKSIRYHSKKRRFFEFLHRLSQTFVLSGGSAAVAAIWSNNSSFSLIATAVIGVSGILDFTFDFSGKARIHNDLYRRLIAVSADMISKHPKSFEEISVLRAERYTIGADSPTIGRVLDAICHNEELQARGDEESHFLRVRWYQRPFAMFIDLPPTTF